MTGQTSGAEILARIKPRRHVESTEIIMSGDLMAQWETAEAELTASRDKDMAGNRLTDGMSKKTRELAQKVAELEEQIKAQAIQVTFQAMLPADWRALCDSHAPRKGNQLDAYAGFNQDAVLDAAVRLCMTEPVFADCADAECAHDACGSWQQFVAVIPPGEWEELKSTVNSTNRGVVDAPKSALASRILRRHEDT